MLAFSKMFHRLSRDLSVKRKEIFVSVNYTHPLNLIIYSSKTRYHILQTKNASLLRDTAYILHSGASTLSVLGASHICSPVRWAATEQSSLVRLKASFQTQLHSIIKHLLSRSKMHFFCITNIHRKPNKKIETKEAQNLCCSNKGCSSPEGI